MDLGEVIYREITNGRSPHTEVTSWSDALELIVGEAGSGRAAARELGIAETTLRGWRHGRTPRDGGDFVLDAALKMQRRARLRPGREARLRKPGALGEAKLVGRLSYDGAPEPDRDVGIGDYLSEVQNDLVDAYLDGASLDELAEIFVDGIEGATFYEETMGAGGAGHMEWDFDSLDGWA